MVAGRLGARLWRITPGPVFTSNPELLFMLPASFPSGTEITADVTIHAVISFPESESAASSGPPKTIDDITRAEVHVAFNRVALSMSCTLPMLLAETRARGIADDDVRTVLAIEETEAAGGQGSDMHFQCFRSNAGVFYITRDTGPNNQLATSAEGFAEL